jgi:hypothetical protein
VYPVVMRDYTIFKYVKSHFYVVTGPLSCPYDVSRIFICKIITETELGLHLFLINFGG